MIGKVSVIAKGGEGILFSEGKPVFIPGVLEGERVEFSVISRARGVLRGKLEKVLTPSPHRIAPACSHYPECGGCNLMHIAYDQQVRCKESILHDNLKQIASLTGVSSGIITSPPFRYRSRLELQIRNGTAGFFRRHSHQVLPIRECWQATEAVQDIIANGFREMDRIRSGRLSIITDGRQVSALLSGDQQKTYLTRHQEITFKIGHYSYLATPENFLQANLFLWPEMTGLVDGTLAGQRYASACDLFCGMGFFTLPLASHADHAYAVENNTTNLKILHRNLEANQCCNAETIECDLYRSDIPHAEVYLADPPRRGLGKRLVEKISAASPKVVLLFSCDSATFSRDLLYFSERGYFPHSLKLIDNFPQTDHFEIFSVLQKS